MCRVDELVRIPVRHLEQRPHVVEQGGGELPPPCFVELFGHSAWPKALISASSCSESSRGTSPRATFSARTCSLMSLTISGLASVVVSPISVKFEMLAITRRMILPERVFGMSGTIQTFFGRAIFPISRSIACETFCAISSLGS